MFRFCKVGKSLREVLNVVSLLCVILRFVSWCYGWIIIWLCINLVVVRFFYVFIGFLILGVKCFFVV